MINRSLSSILVFLLILLIANIYNNYVVIQYNYWFTTHPAIRGLIFCYFLPVILAFFIKQNIEKPSDFLAWTYFFLVLIPTVSLVPYLALDFQVGLLTNFLVLGANLTIFCVGRINENKVIPYVKGINNKVIIGFVVLSTLILIAILSLNYSFNVGKILNLSIFKDAYLIRSEFREAKSETNSLAAYAIFWLAKVFLPFFISYGLAFKKRIFLIIGILLQILIFSISAHKSFVFSIMLILIIYYLMKYRVTFYQWILGLFSLALISFLSYKILNFSFLIDVIIRRSLVVPGVLSSWWVNYFYNNNYVYFKNSFLGRFFESTYITAAPFVIGDYYFGSDWTSANVNFAIDAFGNGGILTTIFFLFFLTLLLLIINKFSQGSENHKLFTILLTVPTFWSFIETSFISVLVTHGLFLTIMILIFFRKS